jgi:hypothetical protein
MLLQLLPLMKDKWQFLTMTNKSPFEIRLDVLKMAQEMLEAERRDSQVAEQQKVELLKSTDLPVSEVINYINAPRTAITYTEAEVLSRASALYAFVDNKTKT